MHSQKKEGLRNYVTNSLKYYDLPLPIIFKIKKGIFMISSLYKISEGVSISILDGLK
jgi:hypothetical protein